LKSDAVIVPEDVMLAVCTVGLVNSTLLLNVVFEENVALADIVVRPVMVTFADILDVPTALAD
jgi:hypothetical protein